MKEEERGGEIQAGKRGAGKRERETEEWKPEIKRAWKESKKERGRGEGEIRSERAAKSAGRWQKENRT